MVVVSGYVIWQLNETTNKTNELKPLGMAAYEVAYPSTMPCATPPVDNGDCIGTCKDGSPNIDK